MAGSEKEKVYVQLINEGSICYRPTEALKYSSNVYRLMECDNYDIEDEIWEFKPGTFVRCEKKILSVGEVLVAIAQVNDDDNL